jgi:hypothetical protein
MEALKVCFVNGKVQVRITGGRGKVSEKKDWEERGIYKLQDRTQDNCCSFHVHYYANLKAHTHSIIQQML